MKQDYQASTQEHLSNDSQTKRVASWPIKIMVGYLEFAQGCVYAIASTIPYAYKNLPDYFTLSIFMMCTLPFALKFITAPLLEKFTSLRYGKRKTWVVINQTAVGLLLLLASFYTGEDQKLTFALILFPIYIGISMQAISLDGLYLKQLQNPKLMSIIQAGCQSIGNVTGGLVLLKLTSEEFAEKIGMDHPISTLQTVLMSFSILVLLPTVLIHFYFRETRLDTRVSSTNFDNIRKKIILHNQTILVKNFHDIRKIIQIIQFKNQDTKFILKSVIQTFSVHKFCILLPLLDTDQSATKRSILKVYGLYKNFFRLQYRYCRTLIFFLLFHQGINFVLAGLNYQYIKAGFTRDDLNTIDNAQNIAVNILVFMFGMKALHYGFKLSFMIQMSLIVSLYLAVQIFFPKTIVAVTVVCFLYGMFYQWGVLLRSNLSAHFPEMSATGMIYTMNSSMRNLGRNNSFHTALLNVVPWKTASRIGLAIQIAIIAFFIPNMIDWIEEGQTDIQFQMSEVDEDGGKNEIQLKLIQRISIDQKLKH